MKHLLFCVVLAVAADACGGGNKVTGPVPCDTYTGGIIGTGALPGTYDLKSVCSGMKPDQPGASGTVTITGTDFTASIGTTTYSGMYTLSNPDVITVNLTSPLPTQLVGTYRLRNDSLAVSGTVAGQRLSLVGTRVP
ncbi:MAG: hypothetical protein DMD57_04450 [Gemmatimonadetes bacterium]|nr:MAG: hypothetical protein DMD57_04450 [Gemmatimonadota bacterium]